TLNGGGQGSVLTIGTGAAVTLSTLIITGGTGTFIPAEDITGGGGINNENGGALTLNGTAISGNTVSGDGGGIISAGGSVTLNGTSSISGNTAGSLGGG